MAEIKLLEEQKMAPSTEDESVVIDKSVVRPHQGNFFCPLDGTSKSLRLVLTL